MFASILEEEVDMLVVLKAWYYKAETLICRDNHTVLGSLTSHPGYTISLYHF